MLSVKNCLKLFFFRKKLLVNMLCDMQLLCVENRNHVWRDLPRLVDVGCKKMAFKLTFSGEHAI